MEASDFIIVVAGLFFAGLIKGTTGIGYSTCAIPFLVAGVGLKAAMAIVLVPAIASNGAVIFNSGGLSIVALRFWRFYGGIIPGIAGGTYALTAVNAGSATQLLGWITMIYVVLALLRPDMTLPPKLERVLALPAGLLNGFLTGLTGSQILPLMPYMMALRLPAEQQIQAVNLAVTLASVVMAVSLLSAGIMTVELLALSVVGAIPALMGVAAGSHLRPYLSPQAFRFVTLGLLGIIGAALVGYHPPAVAARASQIAPRKHSVWTPDAAETAPAFRRRLERQMHGDERSAATMT